MLPKITLNKKDKVKGLLIPDKFSEDLAYLCGVLAGDGSISYRSNKHEYSIKCVGNPKDEKEFYHIVIGPKFKRIFGLKLNFKYLDKNTTYGFRIFSKSLVIYLTKYIGLPLGRKYNFLYIPKCFSKNNKLIKSFIKGVFDTDGCITFKKKYKNKPYYPVISFSSKSEGFVREIAMFLKEEDFKLTELYNYKITDYRAKGGFTIINRIDINGKDNFRLWTKKIGFYSPKHLNKIEKYWDER